MSLIVKSKIIECMIIFDTKMFNFDTEHSIRDFLIVEVKTLPFFYQSLSR